MLLQHMMNVCPTRTTSVCCTAYAARPIARRGDQQQGASHYSQSITLRRLHNAHRRQRCFSQSSVSKRAPRATVCHAASSSGSDLPKDCERSNLINQELILFIFQIDLDQSLQRALNYESYPTAQQIRTKREEVDLAVKQLQAAKGEGAGARGGAQSVVVDVAAEGLRLRSELQRAVEEERYSDAAQLRDQLNQLVNLSRVAEAAVQEAETPVLFRLGERVKHNSLGWRGVVVGWDVGCCEGDRWRDNSRAAELVNGLRQPFYHVLVDHNDWRSATYPDPPVAYVAQERLSCPRLASNTTWLQEYGPEPLEHPYAYVLFLGQDAEGNLLPCRQLRDKFAVERKDVHPPGADDSSSSEEPEDDKDDDPTSKQDSKRE